MWPCLAERENGVFLGLGAGGTWLSFGWLRFNGDTSSGAFRTGTKDVWQNAILAELLKNSRGRTPENVLLHGCAMRLVGLRLLDSVGKDSAAPFVSRKQVAALYAGYGWAGHVARKDSSHPGHAAIKWRNVRWWEFMKSVGAGSRDHSWRHRRRNWVRSFEHGLSKILSINWWEVVNLDRTSWKEGKHKFVVGEGPNLSGKRLLLTIWPVRQC